MRSAKFTLAAAPKDGNTIRTVDIYTNSVDAPAVPTERKVPPYGWTLGDPIVTAPITDIHVDNTGLNTSVGAMTAWRDMEISDPQYGVFGPGWKIAKGNKDNSSNSKYVVDRIYFIPREQEATLELIIAASAEMGYDGVLVGDINVAATNSTNWANNNGKCTKGQTANATVDISIPANNMVGQLCFVDVVFRKDSSSHSNDDCGFYRIRNQQETVTPISSENLWKCWGVVVDGVLDENGWQGPVRIDGEDGKDGQDAVTLLATTVLFNVPCDEEGCAERDVTLTSHVQMLYGETPMPISVSLDDDESDFEATISAATGSTTVKMISVSVTKDTLITADSHMVFNVTGTHEGVTYTRTLNIPIIGNRKGDHGEPGHVGKMFYMAGDYPDGGALYESSEWVTPIVHVKNGTTNEWYWLDAESNVIPGTDPQEYYAPASNSPVWKKAFSEYKVVLTEALFADFASLGSGIVSGDYLFSKHGTINGIDYVNGALIDNVVPAYMFFNDGQTRTFAASGNVKKEAEHTVVARVYLCAGCTVEVSATGKVLRDTGTGFTTLAVFKQGAAKHVGSTVAFSGTDGVQRTLTFTATETAAYEIGFYFPTYYEDKICILENGAIQITGQGFLPNWFVDLKTGRMSAAKGNFVVDGDTVVMQNAQIKGSLMAHKLRIYGNNVPAGSVEEIKLFETTREEVPFHTYQVQGGGTYNYYMCKSCKLLNDQVYLAATGNKNQLNNAYSQVNVVLPPPHLFIGQRIVITNATEGFANSGNEDDDVGNVLGLLLVKVVYCDEDGTAITCMTGEDAKFEYTQNFDSDEVVGAEDENNQMKEGKPFVNGSDVNYIEVSGILSSYTVQTGSSPVVTFVTKDCIPINKFMWIELTAISGEDVRARTHLDSYQPTGDDASAIKYNAYWALTRWEKK